MRTLHEIMKDQRGLIASMSNTDLEYFNTGLFTRFMPNTPAGEDAWRTMAEETGNAAVLSIHAKNVIAQLRAAGYSVAKAKKSTQSIDGILTELGELGL